MAIDDSGALDHISELKSAMQEAMIESALLLEKELLVDAASRAPTMDEEYRELNASSGEEPMVGRAGNTSADTDGRVRFIKDESTYLKNCIVDPANAQLTDTGKSVGVKVGNRLFLSMNSHFKYKNLGKNKGTIENQVGPYYDMFEGGTAGAAVNSEGITMFIVEPRGDYPLRPGEDEAGTKKTMLKSITARLMFHAPYLITAAKAVVTRVLSKLGGQGTSE